MGLVFAAIYLVAGFPFVLVARRLDRLEALAVELRAHGVAVACIQADMTRREDVTRTFEEATRDRAVHAAILNAGVTYFGPALDLDEAAFTQMLATNVTSVVALTQRYLKLMVPRGDGAVMIVSSVAGTVPTTYQAAYSGTKAFLNNYGLAVSEELKGTGVSLTVFVPGGIATEMGERSGTARKFKKGDVGMMDADECARHAVRGMVTRDRFVIPGALNVLNDVVLRFVPRTVISGITARIYRDALPQG
jgi:short-subunit dehydrogenase